jgi:hypothetical protein
MICMGGSDPRQEMPRLGRAGQPFFLSPFSKVFLPPGYVVAEAVHDPYQVIRGRL